MVNNNCLCFVQGVEARMFCKRAQGMEAGMCTAGCEGGDVRLPTKSSELVYM